MRIFTTVFLWLLFTLSCRAQNMVPDSSFESNTYAPSDFSCLRASNFWTPPSRGTTDLFCKWNRKKSKKYSMVDIPQNPMGYQEAHSGICYGGFFVFSHGDYREYMQTSLTQPLQKGKTYRFAMYVSLGDYSCSAVDQLGVCFLNSKVFYESSDVITNLNPVYIKLPNAVRKDITKWHWVSVTYTAKGGEQYILFGSFAIQKLYRTGFKPPKDLKTRINQSNQRDAYYYVDDVSLVEVIGLPAADSLLALTTDSLSHPKPDSSFVFRNVLFETNKSDLPQSAYAELDSLVKYLIKNPSYNVQIGGHTDDSGNEKANLKLSYERAKACNDYLLSNGIDKQRLAYKGYGSSEPVADNTTEEGKQQNRRIICTLIRP